MPTTRDCHFDTQILSLFAVWAIFRNRIPAKPGQTKRIDYEYERCGVCNIFKANELLEGVRIVEIMERKTKTDWSAFLKQVSIQYQAAERIT